MAVGDTLKGVIEPYISECRYLKEAQLDYTGKLPKATGQFEIPKPFYCVKTGHFNAVETMICLNQLAYTMLGECSQTGVLGLQKTLSLDEFKTLQTSSYIVKVDELTFRKPINPEYFEGKIELTRISKLRNNLFLRTNFEFSDAGGGFASGKALLAVSLEKIALASAAVN